MILTLLIAGLSTARVPLTLTATFLDVGHGDSKLVQALNGRAVLVDTGESSAVSAGSSSWTRSRISRT